MRKNSQSLKQMSLLCNNGKERKHCMSEKDALKCQTHSSKEGISVKNELLQKKRHKSGKCLLIITEFLLTIFIFVITHLIWHEVYFHCASTKVLEIFFSILFFALKGIVIAVLRKIASLSFSLTPSKHSRCPIPLGRSSLWMFSALLRLLCTYSTGGQ